MPESINVMEPLSAELLEVKVLKSLRSAIQSNRLKPGQRLVEKEIAQQLRVSRVPVRHAIHILERDGLVVIEPHRGASVVNPSDQDVAEIYGLRTALETYAVALIIDRLQESDFAALQAIVEQMVQRAKESPRPDQTDLDLKFHETLCAFSGNRRLLEAWQRLSSQLRMILALKTLVYDDSQFIPRGHQRVLDALRKRDAVTAQRVLSEHIAMSAEQLRKGSAPNDSV